VKPRAARGETRRLVADLIDRGLPFSAVAAALDISEPTVSYHARKLGIPADDKFSSRYDWHAVQRFYDAGNSVSDCQRHFGFARRTFMDAVKGARSPLGRRPPLSRHIW
jgi:transposase-like protein